MLCTWCLDCRKATSCGNVLCNECFKTRKQTKDLEQGIQPPETVLDRFRKRYPEYSSFKLYQIITNSLTL
jgi:hypothetical protein